MNIVKRAVRFLRKHKNEYFFGFGADSEVEMIAAVIGRKPKNIGPATLYDYQLCIQGLDDIPTSSLTSL